VERICGPAVDPEFDQLISALGHIARQKPKPLIDTIMYWRKAKGDVATNAKAEMNQVGLFNHQNAKLLIAFRQDHHSLCSEIFLGGTQSHRICSTPGQVKSRPAFPTPLTRAHLHYMIFQSRRSSGHPSQYIFYVGS